ncbi:UNVERIFIED_ORG: hypothetical protein J2W38_003678 [Variovorax paradoxus]|nr:hypothetical protein [Variovorax paradoxus]
MNRLEPPNVDDVATLIDLAADHGVSSYPHLQGYVAVLNAAYANYEAAQGVASGIAAVNLPGHVVEFLHTHFKSPPKRLKFIKDLRQVSDSRTCPMCGSLHSGTLDHLIPRTPHPAFSIYSRNLVPACKCNSTKNAAMVGPMPGERILHPYFDDCMGGRILRAHFRDHGKAPQITLEVLVDAQHAMRPAIDFHIKTIVSRTSVVRYLGDRWASLCRRPQTVISDLKQGIIDPLQLGAILNAERNRMDELHGSPNNWNSLFVAGLLEPGTFNWLYRRLTDTTYQPGSSLEWT